MSIRKIVLIGLICLINFSTYQVDAMGLPNEYSPRILKNDISDLKKKFPLNVDIIGFSVLGHPIWSIEMGKGKECIILFGSHHGREWMTSMLLMKLAEDIGKGINNRDPNYEILNKISVIFVPMVNPDGVLIQQNRIEKYPKILRKKWIEMNEGKKDFSRWKANAQGIDINRQYPAGWNELQTQYQEPSYKYFKGNQPLETPEAKAVAELIDKKKPLLIASYHSAGREIYFRFGENQNISRDTEIAAKIADITLYELAKPPKEATGGGLTDWFIEEFSRPALTIEIGPTVGETSLPLDVFEEEWQRNKEVPITLLELAKKYIHKKDEK